MDTAIDLFYSSGTPTEVFAKNYPDRKYSVKDKRFICSVCGEYVTLVISGYFSHTNATEASYCEKRVDSKSNANKPLYYKVGLPLYIRKFNDTLFNLCMGFYPLSQHNLKLLSEHKAQVIISSDDYRSPSQRYDINYENFSDSETTLKVIDFIPKKNYRIKITNNIFSETQVSIWSDYADNLSLSGAIFTCHENGGRKIRRGDNIETDTLYYWVTKSLPILLPEGVQIENKGNLRLSNEKYYKIYTIKFISNDENHFNILREFCHDYFKVNLVYYKPKLIPLWPPTVQHNSEYRPLGYGNVFAAIDLKSNSKPQVFKHNNSFYRSLEPISTINNFKYVKFPIGGNTLITIDRRFSLENSLFGSSINTRLLYKPIVFEDDIQFYDGDEYLPPLLGTLQWNGNREYRVYLIFKDKRCVSFPCESSEITGINGNSELILSKIVSQTGIIPIRKIKFVEPNIKDNHSNVFKFKTNPLIGSMTFLPVWAEELIINSIESLNFKECLSTILMKRVISVYELRNMMNWREKDNAN